MELKTAFPFRVQVRLADEPLCEVYQASSLEFPGQRRVKLLRRELSLDPVAPAALLAAAEHAPALASKRLDLPVEWGKLADGRPWLAFEEREGLTVAEKVEKTGLPNPEALTAFLRGVVEGLAALHGRGAAMGTLAPQQVLLEGGCWGAPRLTCLESALYPAAPVHPRTAAAPAVEGSPASRDLYSLGTLVMTLIDAPLPAESAFPVLPEGYERLVPLVDRCLQRDPEDRFADAAELLRALEDPTAQEDAPQEDPFRHLFEDEVTHRHPVAVPEQRLSTAPRTQGFVLPDRLPRPAQEELESRWFDEGA